MLKTLISTRTIPDQPMVADLITAIDKAVYSPQEWKTFLDQLSNAFPRTRISLVSFDKGHKRPAIVFSASSSARDLNGSTWHKHLSASARMDLSVTDLWSILYCDHCAIDKARERAGDPSEGFASSMILKLFANEDSLGILRFELPKENAEDLRTSIVWLISQLIPHLRRAVENSRKLESSSFFHSVHSALLDSRPDPAFVLDSHLHVIHANPPGIEVLRRERGLHAAVDSQIMLLDERAQEALISASEHFANSELTDCESPEKKPAPQIIRFRVEGERDPNVLFLLPLNHAFEFFNTPVTAYACEGALFAVLKYRSQKAEVRHELIQNLFELTKAEANIIGAMVEGQTLQQYAEQSQTAIGTVRWHLKNVMTKTSCKSQTELIRLILNIGTVHI
jgi:DNA-binding CsgD family transcriptional regulator/PAS domain-containing protein